MRKNIHTHTPQNGFTLLEVMIALLVLSIGLLGLAALQATTLKANHGAYQRTQATFIAYDMMDRLRANRTAALAGQCNVEMGETLTGSSSAMCDADVTDWQTNSVGTLLPSGQGSIICTVATSVCEVIVQWDESRQGGSIVDATDLINISIIADL